MTKSWRKHFHHATIGNAPIEEEMEEDGTTYVKYTREVDFETSRKLLSLEYSIKKYK